ncbi:HNH endonuclease [Vibrio owensii]|uniref:HNH endonuclease n=1 Tax=Vibrio owensii TaxID=696485 RepID=UPI002F419BBC
MANIKCAYAGCKNIATNRSRCDEHQTQRAPRKKQQHEFRGDTNQYKTYKWTKLREYKTTRDPLCEWCKSIDEASPTRAVDHWIETQDLDLMYDSTNLVSMCMGCHAKKTADIARFRKKGDFKGMYSYLSQHKPYPMSDKHKKLFREKYL